MHWTAFLAYRRFPAHARVAGDLPCAGCGYNLRSALANGSCPECGKSVGDSLFVLNQPEIVGRSLRTIGKTHLGFLALLLGCVPITGPDWPSIVAFGIMGLLGIVRVMAIGELRYRGAIDTLPIVGGRLKSWWWISIFDALLTCVVSIGFWVHAKNMFVSAAFDAVMTTLVFTWLAMSVLQTFIAGWFGTALATMLLYTVARWEFIIQRGALVAFLLLLPLMFLASNGTNQMVEFATLGLSFLALGLAMVATAAGLTHLGNGAQAETDTWEDLVDASAEGQYSRPTDLSKPEPPPIKLE